MTPNASGIYQKLVQGTVLGSLLGVLLLAPESNFSLQTRNLFHTMQDSFAAIWDSRPEIVVWPMAGLIIPSFLTILSASIYRQAKSEQTKELAIRAFGPCLAATLTLYGALFLALGGWNT